MKIAELEKLSKDRLEDAKALYRAGCYDGAFYICGYVIEIGLKRKMCVTLGWDEYPSDGKYRFLKIHDLEVLLHFSGAEKHVKKLFVSEWSIVMKWNPDTRYSLKTQTAEGAKLMIESIEAIWRNL